MTQGSNRRTALGAILALPLGLEAGAAAANTRTSTSRDLLDRLDAIESKQQIADVLNAYARGNDRVDPALVRSCFWPESTHSHGSFKGSSSDFITFAFKIISALKYVCHHISNIAIEVDGDRAFSECYYFAQHRKADTGDGEHDLFLQGRYIDMLERRNGQWKIIQRRGLSDYTSPPLLSSTPVSAWPAGYHSETYPTDDYYRLRDEFLKRAGRKPKA